MRDEEVNQTVLASGLATDCIDSLAGMPLPAPDLYKEGGILRQFITCFD